MSTLGGSDCGACCLIDEHPAMHSAAMATIPPALRRIMTIDPAATQCMRCWKWKEDMATAAYVSAGRPVRPGERYGTGRRKKR